MADYRLFSWSPYAPLRAMKPDQSLSSAYLVLIRIPETSGLVV
jgi:hypothetical protein